MNENISVGVMTSINLKDRYLSCKNTWGQDFNDLYFFGGYLSNNDDLIKINEAGEDWSSAFLKQQLGLKYMFEKNPNNGWYSIFGCDNVVFKENILNLVKLYDSNKDLILCQTYNRKLSINNFEFEVFAGGAGFIISNSLMKKFYPLIIQLNDEWKTLHQNGQLPESCYACGDIAMSFFVKKYFNVSLTNTNGMYSQPPEFYSNLIDKPLSFHYIKPYQMMSVYENFKK